MYIQASSDQNLVLTSQMANERTFLAWLRTSLSFITIGIGITQLFRLEDKPSKVLINRFVVELDNTSHAITEYGRPLGCIFIVLGILTLLFGVVRYFKVQHMLVKNYYPATRLSVLILISLLLIVVISTFVMVIKSFV